MSGNVSVIKSDTNSDLYFEVIGSIGAQGELSGFSNDFDEEILSFISKDRTTNNKTFQFFEGENTTGLMFYVISTRRYKSFLITIKHQAQVIYTAYMYQAPGHAQFGPLKVKDIDYIKSQFHTHSRHLILKLDRCTRMVRLADEMKHIPDVFGDSFGI